MPDVIGLSERNARSAPEGRRPGGRWTQQRTVSDPDQDGVVIDQRPGPGTQLDEGRQVVIVIGVLEAGGAAARRPPRRLP